MRQVFPEVICEYSHATILPLKCEKTLSSRLLFSFYFLLVHCLSFKGLGFFNLFLFGFFFFFGFSNICIPFGIVILKCECMPSILFKILAPHPFPSPKAGTLPTWSLRITQLTQGWVLLILHENPNTLRDQGDATAPWLFIKSIHVYVNRTIFHIHSDFLSIWA